MELFNNKRPRLKSLLKNGAKNCSSEVILTSCPCVVVVFV